MTQKQRTTAKDKDVGAAGGLLTFMGVLVIGILATFQAGGSECTGVTPPGYCTTLPLTFLILIALIGFAGWGIGSKVAVAVHRRRMQTNNDRQKDEI